MYSCAPSEHWLATGLVLCPSGWPWMRNRMRPCKPVDLYSDISFERECARLLVQGCFWLPSQSSSAAFEGWNSRLTLNSILSSIPSSHPNFPGYGLKKQTDQRGHNQQPAGCMTEPHMQVNGPTKRERDPTSITIGSLTPHQQCPCMQLVLHALHVSDTPLNRYPFNGTVPFP